MASRVKATSSSQSEILQNVVAVMMLTPKCHPLDSKIALGPAVLQVVNAMTFLCSRWPQSLTVGNDRVTHQPGQRALVSPRRFVSFFPRPWLWGITWTF